jgi:hypothetical protein
MTAARPGDAFHLDLDGTVIAGRYIEVDPPHRLQSLKGQRLSPTAARVRGPVRGTPCGDRRLVALYRPVHRHLRVHPMRAAGQGARPACGLDQAPVAAIVMLGLRRGRLAL